MSKRIEPFAEAGGEAGADELFFVDDFVCAAGLEVAVVAVVAGAGDDVGLGGDRTDELDDRAGGGGVGDSQGRVG
ncbi:MAG: hypothetical protein AAGA29_00865 [Planctomycetota bacterium]